MKLSYKIVLFISACVLNTLFFLILPVAQVLINGPRAFIKEKDSLPIEREIEMDWKNPIVPEQLHEIKEVKTYRQSSNKPISSPSRGKALNLSLVGSAGGGDGIVVHAGEGGTGDGSGAGVGIASGVGTGAMTYEPGQTDTDANSMFGGKGPEMPQKAEREGIYGYVEIILVVNENGMATEMEIYRENPAGYGFGKSAIAFLQKARFKPATLQGVPVRQKVRQPFRFGPQDQ